MLSEGLGRLCLSPPKVLLLHCTNPVRAAQTSFIFITSFISAPSVGLEQQTLTSSTPGLVWALQSSRAHRVCSAGAQFHYRAGLSLQSHPGHEELLPGLATGHTWLWGQVTLGRWL